MAEDPILPVTQRRKIEQLIVQRSSAVRLRTRSLAIIIRIIGHHRQLERGDPGQEIVHLAGFGDKGSEHRFVHFAMVERPEIGERLGGAVRLALRGHLLVIGQPDHAAGNCRGTAQPVLFLDQPHRGTGFVRCQRCGKACGPGSDNQNIRFAVDYGTSPVIGLGNSLGPCGSRHKPHFE